MIDVLIFIALTLTVYLALPIAILSVRDWFESPSKQELEDASRQFIERLENPDFAAVEKYFGCPLPDCVRALYADRKELLRSDFEVAAGNDADPDDRWYIAFYCPADAQTMRDCWPGIEHLFAFADDGGGDGYLIDPTQDDPAVLHHCHETGDVEVVCDRFTEFMKWPRKDIVV